MQFFVGIHQPADVRYFERAFVSVNRLRTRKSDFVANTWIMDSGAFTTLATHGRYREEPYEYAEQIARWRTCGKLLAAVGQDYMCEPFMLEKTGMTVEEHQYMTVERYDALKKATRGLGVYIMPVLQGWTPACYVNCLEHYGKRLAHGAWVGVGSVCKRNTNEVAILRVLEGIKRARPDLKLHGFGLKTSALSSPEVVRLLHTSDSMAWSFHARKNGRSPNSWHEAKAFEAKIAEKLVASRKAPVRPRIEQISLFEHLEDLDYQQGRF